MKSTHVFPLFFRLALALAFLVGLLNPALPAEARQLAATQAETWTTQLVQAAFGSTPMGLGLDAGGNVHIAYYNNGNLNGLHHTWFDGMAWQDEFIEGTMGNSLDLAMGSDNQMFVLYNNGDHLLKLAEYDGAAWTTSVITSTVPFEQKEFGAIAVDDNGALHVSFYNRVNDALYYGKRAADTWQFTRIQTGAGKHTDIAIDSLNRPHISYCAVNDLCAGLRHAQFNGSGWTITNLTTALGSGDFSQIAFGLDGRPVIATYEQVGQTVKLFRKNVSNAWESTVIETNTGTGSSLGLGVDDAGVIHMAYELQSSGDLRYARFDGALALETAFATGVVGANPTLTLDQNAKPVIAHQRSDSMILLTGTSLGMDLLVTDIWASGGSLNFQVMNAGLAPVPAGHLAQILIDSVVVGSHTFNAPLGPGERQTVYSVVPYACTGTSDSIQIRADRANLYIETDETNNNRTETWRCNTTPPKITAGPTVSALTTTTATITWVTDQASDSYVGILTKKGADPAWAGSATLVTNHSVTLTGLAPNTTYEALARSTNANTYQVLSRPFYFTTPSGAFTPPTARGISVTRSARTYESYNLRAEVSDPTNVARMDFYIDGVLVGADFTPNALGQYEFDYTPATSGVTRTVWFENEHTFTSTAVFSSGATLQQSSPFSVLAEPAEITLEFTKPVNGLVLSTPDNSMPSGSMLIFDVFAEAYGWRCSMHGGGSPADPDASPALCSDQAQPVEQVFIYLDNVIKGSTLNPTKKTTFSFNLNIAGLALGSHTIRVTARAADGTTKDREIYITVVKADPTLEVSHSGFTEGAYVVVDVTVKNPSSSLWPVTIDKVYETAHGLQWAAQPFPFGTISGTYTPETRNSWLTLSRTSLSTINPGQSLTMRYKLVPVLYEDMQNVSYWLNKDRMTVVEYRILGATKMVGVAGELPTLTTPTGMMTFNMAVNGMMKNADYIIVTNPAQLLLHHNAASVQTLLSKMAELGFTKQGVLGYLDTYDDGSILNNLIAEDSPWLGRLNPVFEDLVDGYVLLVGDLRIIASDRSMSLWMPNIDEDDYKRVHHTDNIYANTQGDGRPDLVVSRLIGSVDTMLTSLQTSLDVYNHANGRVFDKNAVSFVSGSEPNEHAFESSVRELRDTASAYGHLHNEVYFDYQSALWYYEFNFEQFDGVAACDVDGDGDDELLHGDRSSDRIMVFEPATGALLGSLPLNFEEGDGLACGDVDGDGFDEIVFADRADRILLFDYHTGSFINFNWEFEAYDQVDVGNVDLTNPGVEIVIADRDDFIHILATNGALLRTLDLRSPSFAPGYNFMDGDKLAVGNVSSLYAGDEIVFTSRAANKILVVDSSGMVRITFDRDIEYGDDIAIGSPDSTPGGTEELIVGDRSNYIGVYKENYVEGVYTFSLAKEIHSDFEMHDRIVSALVNTSHSQEIIMEFMRDDQISALDISFPAHGLNLLYNNMDGIFADLLMYRGHGNSSGWADVMTASQVRDFGSLAPVVAGITCLSGDYPDLEDNSLAASMLKHGAGLYIGATEVSYTAYNSQMAPMFLTRFFSARATSQDWTHLERNIWGFGGEADYYYYWVYEYNLYGETKFGKPSPTLLASDTTRASIAVPAATLVVDIPDYEVEAQGAADLFTIPDGGLHSVDGESLLPTYSWSVDYPAGTLVQGVSLTGRVLSETFEALTLPVFDLSVIDGLRPAGMAETYLASTAELAAGAAEGWLPGLPAPFSWQVTQNSNGTSTLEILMYPMEYAPATLMANFYNQFTFEITTASTSVQITDLRTSQARYNLNAPVEIAMLLENSGPAQDLSVVAEIRRSRSTPAISSVPFDLVDDLSGEGQYAAVWDSTGIEAGQYILEVRLYNSSSQLIAQRFHEFHLGNVSLEVQNLETNLPYFKTSANVPVAFDVANTGDEALAGIVYLLVQGPEGYTHTLTQTLSLLAPGASVPFSFAWNTTGAPAGRFTVSAFVTFETRVSQSLTLELVNNHKLYLPLQQK